MDNSIQTLMKLSKLISLSLLVLGLSITESCQKEPEPKPNPEPVRVTAVTLNTSSLSLVEGETQDIVATVSPSTADNKKILWTTSNSSVAVVSEGKVTAVKAGTATITATSDDGGKTATCKVTVTEKTHPVESVTLNKTEVSLTVGDEMTLTATITPDNASNKNVEWSTSDSNVATVTDGKVTAVKVGTATITVKTSNGGKTATCTVTVTEKTNPVESVTLNKTEISLTVGDEATLTATVTPDNASNKNVEWSTSDSNVATVTDGKITAVKAGTATITVKTSDGGKTATCTVTVTEKTHPVESVTLNKTEVSLTVGDEMTLTATITPDNASNKNVEWSTSDSNVATVTDGKVMAVKAGTATIIVKTSDGGKTATCTVTVTEKTYPVESVTLNKTELSLVEGDETTLTATITPDNASNKNVEWSTSDSNVATVTDGKVTAVKAGTTTITVKTSDGGKTATCTVTVTEKTYPVESVTLNKTEVSLTVGDETTLTATVKPDNATNKGVEWSTSDSNVATVADGKVTAIKAGTATITVRTSDGGKTASCEVTVTEKSEINIENPDDGGEIDW